MNITVASAPRAHERILQQMTRLEIRPRYEGSNICTWIGFKHVNYLVEEAVLEHFRRAGLTARSLYEDFGLGLDIIDIDSRIAHALHMDDLAVAEVVPATGPADRELCLAVTIHVDRDGQPVKAVTAKVGAVLRIDERGGPVVRTLPELAAFTVPHIARAASSRASIRLPALPPDDATDAEAVLAYFTDGRNAFAWRWRVPYFYCHFTERVQMSGYLRLMEEVVDLFLAERGISIKTLLDDRNFIPVVPHSAVSMLDEALMEEDLYTVFTVEDVFKDLTYTARMDCYVVRDDGLLRTATGQITHGYAVIDGRRDWRLVNFDDRMLRALRA